MPYHVVEYGMSKISVQHIRIKEDRSPRLYAYLREKQAQGVPYARALADLEKAWGAQQRGALTRQDLDAIERIVEAVLSRYQFVAAPGEVREAIETEVAGAALDGGMPWD
jgi:hypothetical protein